MDKSVSLAKQRRVIRDNLDVPGPEGDEARRRFGQHAYDIASGQFRCGNLNFGLCYERSPLIKYDGERAPGCDIYNVEQSTVPGCRTPHIWLGDGVSLHGRLGPDFTLLRFDRAGAGPSGGSVRPPPPVGATLAST
jgi:hypothetical protein